MKAQKVEKAGPSSRGVLDILSAQRRDNVYVLANEKKPEK
jgi:hypothetical protein